MLTKRPALERGGGQYDWLDTKHTFSFADYYDPAHMGFRVLRVMNEDIVAPGSGFGMHPHRDMEIITYVLEGELEHKDSLGSGEVLRPGEVQHMTAGSGIRHSEFNPSPTEPVHLYQIWLLPRETGLNPAYQQKPFPRRERAGKLRVVASADGRDGSLKIEQDVDLSLALLAPGQKVSHELRPGRHAWLQVLRGDVAANGLLLAAGDGLAVSDESLLTIASPGDSEVMLFDLP